jgi:outer membrane biosynthesis protein TonB
MTDPANQQPTTIMENNPETTPDQLLDTFRGRGLKTIILFTIAVHLVILLLTSVPYFMRTVAGKDTANLSEEERVKLAMKEATSSLRQIAEAHGLRPQDLSSRLDGAAPRAPREEAAPVVAPATPAEEEKPKSEIEKEIEKVKEGPAAPPIEEEVDLFK